MHFGRDSVIKNSNLAKALRGCQVVEQSAKRHKLLLEKDELDV